LSSFQPVQELEEEPLQPHPDLESDDDEMDEMISAHLINQHARLNADVDTLEDMVSL
jgi:hypothetical protein